MQIIAKSSKYGAVFKTGRKDYVYNDSSNGFLAEGGKQPSIKTKDSNYYLHPRHYLLFPYFDFKIP